MCNKVLNQKTVGDMLSDVSRFNAEVIGIEAPDSPRLLELDRLQFALGHMNEELLEFSDAHNRKDLGASADALIDLIYVALGRLYEMGMPFGKVFDDVHEANMMKKRGKKERDVEHDDDAVKPEGWTAPDHSWLANLSPAFIEVAKLRAKKHQDYQNSDVAGAKPTPLAEYFPFGLVSHVQMLWIKILRLKNFADRAMVDCKDDPNFEGIKDSLMDLCNYASFAIEDIDGVLDGRDGKKLLED